MRILVFLFFLQSFIACQQDQDKAGTLEASLTPSCATTCQQTPEKTPPSATNIVFKSIDGGTTWEDVSAGLPEKPGIWNVFAHNDQVFLISEKELFRSGSTASMPVWEKEYLLDNRIMGIFPGKTGSYALGEWGNFYQAVSGTGIWKPVYPGMKEKMVRTILEAPGGAIFAGCDNGIFKSSDGGNTWKQVYTGNMVLSLTSADGVLLGSANQGVLRSTDGGEHWDCALKCDGISSKTVVIGDRLVAITRNLREEGPWEQVNKNSDNMVNSLYTSTDKGKSWQRIGENIPGILEIEDVVQAGKYLVCSCDTGIFRSSDWGKTWEFLMPASEKKGFDLSVSGQVMYAVKVFRGGC